MALPNWQRTIVTESGDVVSGAEIGVVDEATGLDATLYSDRDGNAALSNPFFTGSDGFAEFYTAPGNYRVTATGPSGTRTWRYEVLDGSASIVDTGLAAAEVPKNSDLDSALTVTADHTIGDEKKIIVNTDASTTVAITIPSGLPIGTRKKITRIGAYDTANTNRVRLLPSGTEYITAGQLTDVPIYGNGGNWEIQKVGSLRWEIVGGYDRGSNSNGDWERLYSGSQNCNDIVPSVEFSLTSSSGDWRSYASTAVTFAIPFGNDSVYITSTLTTGGGARRVPSIAGGPITATGFAQLQQETFAFDGTTNQIYTAFGRWYQEV